MAGSSVIVMGVCASGKTTIGELLAEKLGRKFIDGDDLHPRANIQKMASDKSLILERMRQRQGHFMKENMVNSQFETLERPDGEPRTLLVSIDTTIEDVVANAAELILEQDEAQA